MNTQLPDSTKKDFSEAKRVLGELSTYINNKITTKTNTNQQNATAVINQGMTLASQPELVSDHLSEERPLVGIEQSNQPGEQIANQQPEYINTAAGFQVPSVDNQDYANQSVMPQTTSAIEYIQTPSVSIQQGDSQNDMLNNNAEITNLSAQTASITSQPADIKNEPYLDTTPMAQSTELIDASTPSVDIQPFGTSANAANPSPENFNAISQEFINVPQATTQNEPMQPPLSEPINNINVSTIQPQVPGMEQVPEIGIPNAVSQETGYQATSQPTATVSIPASMNIVSSEPVVMPTGTTAEMANDASIVVGPDSFGIGR